MRTERNPYVIHDQTDRRISHAVRPVRAVVAHAGYWMGARGGYWACLLGSVLGYMLGAGI